MVNFRPLTVEGSLEDLERGRVAMSLNEPRIGPDPCVVEGPLTVRGWAHARGGIESVHVTVDGERYETLRPIVRTDLLEYYGSEAAAEAGFSLRLHPTECPPGVHRVAVVAVGRDGDAVGVEGEVVCRPGPPDESPPPGPVANVDWIEDRKTPRAAPSTELYDPDAHAGTAWEAEHQLRYRWAAGAAAGREVLDVGCQLGWGVVCLAEAGARRVAGVDEVPENVERARRRAGEAGAGVELTAGSATALPFEDESFDLVTSFEARESGDGPEAAAAELRRVLRRDGVLLVRAGPGLERALRAGFAHVRAYRQLTSLASALFDDAGAGDEASVRALNADGRGSDAARVLAVADDAPPDLGPAATFASAEAIERLHGLALMWESRALLAEADAAASRVEAGLASVRQEAAMRMLRAAEERLRAVDG